MSDITLATEADIEAIASLFARAFRHDPMANAGIKNDAARATMFGVLVSGYTAAGAIWHIDQVGAATWLPPGSLAAIESVDSTLRAMANELTDDAGVAHTRFWDWIWEQIPDEDCWFLDVVGVDPDRQGERIGTRLIRHGLEMAEAAGLPALLDTALPANVGYYESLGFRIHDDADAPGGGPHVWFMRKDPIDLGHARARVNT